MRRQYQTYLWKEHLYVPLHSVLLSCGTFLAPSCDVIEKYVKFPRDFTFAVHDRFAAGVRTYHDDLAAALAYGDSMIDANVRHGDIIVFWRKEFPYIENGNVLVIEKVGDEEGFGAWSLKRLVTLAPEYRSLSRTGNEADWNDPVVIIRSHNRRIKPSELDPTKQYRLHGIRRRVLRPGDKFSLVDPETIYRAINNRYGMDEHDE